MNGTGLPCASRRRISVIFLPVGGCFLLQHAGGQLLKARAQLCWRERRVGLAGVRSPRWQRVHIGTGNRPSASVNGSVVLPQNPQPTAISDPPEPLFENLVQPSVPDGTLPAGRRRCPQIANSLFPCGGQPSRVAGMGLEKRLVDRALVLAVEAFDDDEAVWELARLGGSDLAVLDAACDVCITRPVSLATRARAIGLLARVRYRDL
jgi:hypothetical protein